MALIEAAAAAVAETETEEAWQVALAQQDALDWPPARSEAPIASAEAQQAEQLYLDPPFIVGVTQPDPGAQFLAVEAGPRDRRNTALGKHPESRRPRPIDETIYGPEVVSGVVT